jgi:hypothetical protein
MVIRGNITVQHIAEANVSRISRVSANRNPSGNDVTVAHQNVNALKPLVHKVKAVALAKQPGGSRHSIGFQSKGSGWLHEPEPSPSSLTVYKKVKNLILLLLG